MLQRKLNQSGFSAIFIALIIAVLGAVGVIGARVVQSNNAEKSAHNQEANETQPISTEDATVLEQAKDLKKVDHDLDGANNTEDSDDDNDGIDDTQDADDDNDDVNDDKDDDDDNDGSKDEDDTKEDEADEAAELEAPDQD